MVKIFYIVQYKYNGFYGYKGGGKIMEGISHKLYMWKYVLYNAITNNELPINSYISKLIQKLDEVIV